MAGAVIVPGYHVNLLSTLLFLSVLVVHVTGVLMGTGAHNGKSVKVSTIPVTALDYITLTVKGQWSGVIIIQLDQVRKIMKNVITALLILVSFNAFAQSEEDCKTKAQFAKWVMDQRQQEADMFTVLDKTNHLDSELREFAKNVIMGAYSYPLKYADKNKRTVSLTYSNEIAFKCMNHK